MLRSKDLTSSMSAWAPMVAFSNPRANFTINDSMEINDSSIAISFDVSKVDPLQPALVQESAPAVAQSTVAGYVDHDHTFGKSNSPLKINCWCKSHCPFKHW